MNMMVNFKKLNLKNELFLINNRKNNNNLDISILIFIKYIYI